MTEADISADRWVMCRRTLAFIGYDFTGATFKTEIRQTRDTGAALVTLTTQTTDVQGIRLIYGGTATIAAHQAAGRLSAEEVEAIEAIDNPATGQPYSSGDSVALSLVMLRVDKATMSALPFPASRGGDIDLYWDLHITPSGGDEGNYAGGTFTVVAGATQ
jgi:hypothetical protein